MKRNSISALVITLAVGLVLFIGLVIPRTNAPLTSQPPLKQQRLNYQGNMIRTNPSIATPQPSVTPQRVNTVDRHRTDNIHKQLSKMGELRQVGVIITGNTALVGYSPSHLAKDVSSTKALITSRVKQIDPSIKNVVVSESADIMSRINKLTTDISNNRPANEISNEINQLLKGVAPTIK
jgi:YhcN/YlaJ family sporulation lipoprotein